VSDVAAVEREHRVSPVELFFDLVVVFAFTQVTTFWLHHPSWSGLGRGLLLASILLVPLATAVPALVAVALVGLIWFVLHGYELIWWRENGAAASRLAFRRVTPRTDVVDSRHAT
jgi:hypothetical protein